MKDFEDLEEFYGSAKCLDAMCYRGVRLMRLDTGRVLAIDYRSTNPIHLRTSDERAAWARFVGFAPTEVERYVRAEKRRRKGDELVEDLKNAARLLAAHAGVVEALKAKGEME